MFQETLDVRPHLLILNKKDLADVSDKQVRGPALVCTLQHVELNKYSSEPEPNLCPAEPPEDACKKGGEERFVHRLFKAKRRQRPAGEWGSHPVGNIWVVCPRW